MKCSSRCEQRAGLAQWLAVLGLIVPAFGNCADVPSGAPPAPDRAWQQPNVVTYSTWAKRFDEAQIGRELGAKDGRSQRYQSLRVGRTDRHRATDQP
jgi:hypothetical protein